MDIWVVGTLRDFCTQIKFSLNKVISGKTLFFPVGPYCSPHSICLDTDFKKGSFSLKYCILVLNLKMVLQKRHVPISGDCQIKLCQSFKRRTFSKLPSIVF